MDSARLQAFLVKAKQRTYAGLDDDATISAPLFPGSKQLEFSERELGYRDIYFGMAYFVGQEVVTDNARAVWSMSYAGGASRDIVDRSRLLAIYAFLRHALLAIREDAPFRGPPQIAQGAFRYINESSGDVSGFHGVEQILQDEAVVYSLRYSGGIIR